MSDTFTLTAEVDTDQAQRDVDAFVSGQTGTVKLDATVDSIDTTTLDTAIETADTPTIDLDLEADPADVTAVGDALDDLDTPISDAKTKVSGLRGVLQNFGLTSLGVGEAVALVGTFVQIGTRLWDAYNSKTKLTEQITGGVSDALLEQSGALDIMTSELEDLVASAATPAEVLDASIWKGIEAEQGAGEVEKLRTALLDLGLGLDDLGATVQSFEDYGAQFATALFQGNVSAEKFEQTLQGLRESGELPPNVAVSYQEWSEAIGEAIESGEDLDKIRARMSREPGGQALISAFEDEIRAIEQLNDAQENVDYSTLMQEQLDAAAQSETLSAALEDVYDELGRDAPLPDIWNAYTAKLLELQGAADETDASLDAATEDRTGEVDVELEQAQADAEALRAEMEGATEPRTAEVETEVTGAAEADDEIDEVAEDRQTDIETDAPNADATAGEIDETAAPRTTGITLNVLQALVAKIILDAVAAPRTATITANALTAAAEIELNNTARTRTSYVNQVVRRVGGGGSSSSSLQSSRSLSAEPMSFAAPAANVVINTAVIGNRYDVMRAVSEATRSSVRLAGRRQLIPAGGRNP